MMPNTENTGDRDSLHDASLPDDTSSPGNDTIQKGSFTSSSSVHVSKRTLILIMILAIAAISIGAITVSLFADQHDWNTGKACLDCHDDVGQEFTDMLGTPGVEPHEGLSCTDCHQNVSADFDDQHAATLPNCTSCHSTVITNMSYDTEAHKEMLYNAGSSIYNKGPNEACIVCHTGFDVNTTFKRPDYFNFTVDSSYSITNVEVSTTTHQNTYTWTKTGELHTYIAPAGVNCGDGVDGCHNDVVTARGGISGGHHTSTQPLNVTHLMNTPCDTCHVNSLEVPDTNYHAAKNISCAYRLNGCHDRGDTHVSTNMTTIFSEITSAAGMSRQKEGDLCWGCHNGYNWLDPPVGNLRIQVWTEPSNTVNVWNESTSAFEQVYPRAVTGCADCHDDVGTNRVPFGSGKYINHLNESVANYDYTHCEDCHNTAAEPWYPHDIPHAIDIDWTAYASAGDTNVDNAFCDVVCHYSDWDSRVPYQDASTPWMQDIYTSFTNDGALHRTSTYIDADGTVECVDCHPDHLQKPDDTDDGALLNGGSSIQGCGDQVLGVGGCHLIFNAAVDGPAIDDRETPVSHGTSPADNWNSVGRNDCTEANCHDKHNYPLNPTEGHNPTANCHPGGISCGVDSNSHIKHIAADWGIPDYDYNCSQCHFNDAGALDGWYDTTYGTPEHNNGVLNVHFNGTSPLTTVAIANYSGALSTTFNGTGNMECANTYCHSDGNVSGFTFSVVPDWDNPNVGCGDCHNMPMTSYAHRRHTGDNLPNADPDYVFNCSECHYSAGTSAAGWYDSTYGSILHVDGKIDVAFNVSANGIASYGNTLAPVYNGDDTCDNVYCHSNGNAAGFITYNTPAWNSGTPITCGECHGMPNYDPGTDRELGGTTTGNSYVHLKHVRNWDGLYPTRDLFWADNTGNPADITPPFGWQDSDYDVGEAILQDLNGNRMLDYGILNGGNNQGANPPQSPDNVYTSGTADLRDFTANDNVYFYDSITANGVWDRNEDIYYEVDMDNDGTFDVADDDILLYIGTAQDIADGNAGTQMIDDVIMYLDSDHDEVYDCWWDTGVQAAGDVGITGEFSGFEEALVYVGAAGKATGDSITDTDEVLEPAADELIFWYFDWNTWYDYDCSECHNSTTAPTAGYGTYGTISHVDMVFDVAFDGSVNGVAAFFNSTIGSDPGAWDSTNKECYGIWCHSDGVLNDADDGFPDWSGTGIFDGLPANDYHTVKPRWTDTTRTTVNCGSCHYGWDKPTDMAGTDKPNTNAHRLTTQHSDADNFYWHDGNDVTPCQECHWRYDTFGTANENQWWRPYGSVQHVDGSIWCYPKTSPNVAGIFGPLSGDNTYETGCHRAGGLGDWTGGYGTGC